MKVDRLITCLNNNPTYVGFWNTFSPVWAKKFNLKPTLAFVGTQAELDSLKLSTEHGDIIRLDPISEVRVDTNLDWSVTWALFWTAAQFSEEVCMLQGIDQMPLSNLFFESIKDIDSEKYVIGFSDAYENGHPQQFGYHPLRCEMFPSSHHVAKGKTFSNIYYINDDWEKEIKKVFQYRGEYYLPKNLWGLDECYSSQLIDDYKKKYGDSIFFNLKIFKSHWANNRVDRVLHTKGKELQWDSEKLKKGQYSELHAPRPYTEYTETISKFIKEFMKVEL